MASLQWHMVYKLGKDDIHRAPVVALKSWGPFNLACAHDVTSRDAIGWRKYSPEFNCLICISFLYDDKAIASFGVAVTHCMFSEHFDPTPPLPHRVYTEKSKQAKKLSAFNHAAQGSLRFSANWVNTEEISSSCTLLIAFHFYMAVCLGTKAESLWFICKGHNPLN